MANLNDARAKVTHITLSDGIERELKYTLNAMAEMEERYGSVEKAFEALESNSMKAIRFVLWAGLIHADDTLTERQVGNLIDMKCLHDIVDNVGEAITEGMPSTDGENLPNA